jgi:hypothetical protein
MKSNAQLLISASVVGRTDTATLLEITPGFGEEPWRMELDHRIAEPMGREKAAAYVTEHYLINHPLALAAVGRDVITVAVLFALTPQDEWPQELQEL